MLRWVDMLIVVAFVVLLLLLLLNRPANATGDEDPLADEMPVVALMPEMRGNWVARRMAYNGVPMSIRSFSSKRSAEDVIQYYESRWKTFTGAHIQRSRADGMETLGVRSDGYYYTVQVRDDGANAQGNLVVTRDLQKAKPDIETDFPLVPGTEVLVKTESLDVGKRAETVVALSERSVASVSRWMDSELRRGGWTKQDFGPTTRGPERVMQYQKGAELCQVTLVANSPLRDGHTSVLVNWIKQQ